MSIKSFFETVGSFIKKIFGSTTVQQTIRGTMAVLTPVIVEIVQLALGPVAGTAAEDILSQIQSDYGTLAAIVSGATSNSSTSTITTINNLVASLKSNLAALLSDAGVKNSAHFATIQQNVDFFLNEIGAVETALGLSATSSGSATAAAAAPLEAEAATAATETASASAPVQEPSPSPAPLPAGVGSVAPAAGTPAHKASV